MRLLNRPELNVNLQKYRQDSKNWGDISKSDREKISLTLLQMSNNRCAYCESNISTINSHIEHFAPRSSNAKLVFEWENLFSSCQNENSCGKFKDNKKKYKGDGSDLIKPDVDNPVDYFIVSEIDGQFSVKSNLSPLEIAKAENTINYFNLNLGSLVSKRKNIFRRIDSMLRDVSDTEISEDELIYIKQYIKKYLVEEELFDLGYLQSYLNVIGISE